MRIDRLEFFHVDIPLAVPFHPSWAPGYTARTNHYTILRMTTDTGLQGLSTGMCHIREHDGLPGAIAGYLLGADPTNIPDIHQRLYEASIFGWRNFWVEAACWDICGQAEGKPVWKLLGGDAITEVEVYASTGEIHSPAQRADEVLQLAEMGFRTVKLRVHAAEIEDDIAQVQTVRRAVGDRMDICVDANQARRRITAGHAPLWTLDRASAFARACQDLGVLWLEEPLDEHAYDELAELCKMSALRIAGGELNGGWHEFKVMLEKGSYDIYQPDAIWGGGISDSLRVMQACRTRGLGYSPHAWSNGLGFLINLQLYAAGTRAFPFEYSFDPPAWVPEVRDAVLAEPIRCTPRGTIYVPQEPGFGIVIDEDKLAHYGEKFCDVRLQRLY